MDQKVSDGSWDNLTVPINDIYERGIHVSDTGVLPRRIRRVVTHDMISSEFSFQCSVYETVRSYPNAAQVLLRTILQAFQIERLCHSEPMFISMVGQERSPKPVFN